MSDESRYVERRSLADVPAWSKLRAKPTLGHLDIELTERCANNCIHCYINLPPGDQVAKQRELSLADWCAIADQVTALGCFSVRLTGGEPL
ncbi:MAG: hypothetical protein L0Y55_16220, partial [Anaerolineales bacterium]|nr:hypothetical protein [Anaerolineales bacterium]